MSDKKRWIRLAVAAGLGAAAGAWTYQIQKDKQHIAVLLLKTNTL
jgi:23S rRNA C2498 (ribose-2'-O)-methylase RlmM